MKKKCVFVIFLIMFLFVYNVDASTTGTVNVNDALYLRESPSASSASLTYFYNGTELNVLNTNAGSDSVCSAWYKVSFGSYTGYVCGDYVILNSVQSSTNNEDDSYLRSNYDNPPSKDGYVACYEDTKDVTLRTSAAGSYSNVKVSCGEEVTINSVYETNNGYWWYNVTTSNNKTGYIQNIYVNTTKMTPTATDYYNSSSNSDTVSGYTATLKNAGFPDSYIPYLLEIHARYPKWNFVAEKINLNFDDVVDGESGNGASLLQKSAFSENYLSTNKNTYDILTDTFYDYSSEPGWYNASKEAIAYYLDPRNYLNQKYIFAFETLGYSANQSTSLVSSIISNQSFFNTIYSKNWSDGTNSASGDIVKASSVANISALHVATRIKQEMGTQLTVSDSRLGGSFTYNGSTRSGYYNFFNIKSNCTNCSSIYSGYAYEQGWNTPYKGILGGSSFLAKNYIALNQDTLYYERFDVSRDNTHYTHQYMQNLTAPVSEGGTTYTGYLSSFKSYLDTAITFVIPIYNNMPLYAVTSPSIGNPNNYLSDIKINGATVSNFSYNTYNYNIHLSKSTTSVVLTASKINSNATISGTGTIAINSNEQTNIIYVTSQSGKVRQYTLRFIRDAAEMTTVSNVMANSGFKYNDNYLFGINLGTNVSQLIANVTSYNNSNTVSIKTSSGTSKTNEIFKTGDTVTVAGSDGNKTYRVVIYGDVNGDGKISAVDYMKVKNYIMNVNSLSGEYLTAADVNKDGKVSAVDYMKIKNNIMNGASIEQ